MAVRRPFPTEPPRTSGPHEDAPPPFFVRPAELVNGRHEVEQDPELALDEVNQDNDVAAINTLEAFINAVEAQRGKKIADTDADALIALAEEIIFLLLEGM